MARGFLSKHSFRRKGASRVLRSPRAQVREPRAFFFCQVDNVPVCVLSVEPTGQRIGLPGPRCVIPCRLLDWPSDWTGDCSRSVFHGIRRITGISGVSCARRSRWRRLRIPFVLSPPKRASERQTAQVLASRPVPESGPGTNIDDKPVLSEPAARHRDALAASASSRRGLRERCEAKLVSAARAEHDSIGHLLESRCAAATSVVDEALRKRASRSIKEADVIERKGLAHFAAALNSGLCAAAHDKLRNSHSHVF